MQTVTRIAFFPHDLASLLALPVQEEAIGY